MLYTRRELGKLALAAVPVSPFLIRSALAAGKPNSKFAGVQVGLNVPYNFGNNWMSGDDTLARCVELGVSAVELRSQPVELFLGTPATPPPTGGSGGGRATPTPEQVAARKGAAASRARLQGVASPRKGSRHRGCAARFHPRRRGRHRGSRRHRS